nr:aminotransferase class IV [Sporichthyaceae bacterium]
MKAWVNGDVIDEAEARVSVFDHGITVGDGVFETAKVVDGVPFALSRHLARLGDSARGLGLPAPASDDVRRAVEETFRANTASLDRSLRLRITLTGGVGPLGSD